MSQAYHLIVAPPGEPQLSYELKGAKVGLGRSPDHQICIGLKAISGNHCEFQEVQGGGYIVTDSGSTNGTKVNGKPVTQLPLSDGDRLLLGESIPAFFVVTAPGEEPKITEPSPVAADVPAQAPPQPGVPGTLPGTLPAAAPLPTSLPAAAPTAPAAPVEQKPTGAPAPVPGQVSPTVPLQKTGAAPAPGGGGPVVVPQKKAAAAGGPAPLKPNASSGAPPSLKPSNAEGTPPSLQKKPPTAE